MFVMNGRKRMKIRKGFVSNSSSSSFIVYDKNDTMIEPQIKPDLIYDVEDWIGYDSEKVKEVGMYYQLAPTITLPTREGKSEFGWDFERCYDILGKLNWCAIQLLYAKKRESNLYIMKIDNNTERVSIYEMIRNFEEVMRDELHLNIKFDYNSIEDDSPEGEWAGIDHQSTITENIWINEFFADKEAIKAFLCGENSYYQGGNDNSDYPDSYLESWKKMDPKEYEEYMLEKECGVNWETYD